MMAQFSPFTRRVVAIGILVLGLFALVNLLIVPLYGLTAGSLSGLEDARFQRARLEAIAARPPLPRSDPVPSTLYLTAPDRQRAVDTLISAIGGSAARYEIQLDNVAPLPADPARPKAIALSFSGRGEQDRMLAWINELEIGPPAIRFGEWSLGQDAGEGEGAAPLAASPPPPEGANPGGATAPAAGATRLAFTATAAAVWEAGR
jgi:hypothetical protein